jgi:SulP family sulfate permease
MAVIGGLIIVIGGELLVGRVDDIRLVLRTDATPAAAMIVMFLATTFLPLQQAILLGAGLSLILFCAAASRQGRLLALVPSDAEHPDRWRYAPVPEEAPSGAVTILQYAGSGHFAEVARIDERWPRTTDTHDAVIILVVRTLPDIPSTTLLKSLERRSDTLRAHDVRLMFVGVDQETYSVFKRSGFLEKVGAENVIPATDEVLGDLELALTEANAWVAQRRAS